MLRKEQNYATAVGTARFRAVVYMKLREKSAEIREVSQLWESVTKHPGAEAAAEGSCVSACVLCVF